MTKQEKAKLSKRSPCDKCELNTCKQCPRPCGRWLTWFADMWQAATAAVKKYGKGDAE